MAIRKVYRLRSGLWVEREQTGLPRWAFDGMRKTIYTPTCGRNVDLVHLFDLDEWYRRNEAGLTEYGRKVGRVIRRLVGRLSMEAVERARDRHGYLAIVQASYGSVHARRRAGHVLGPTPSLQS